MGDFCRGKGRLPGASHRKLSCAVQVLTDDIEKGLKLRSYHVYVIL